MIVVLGQLTNSDTASYMWPGYVWEVVASDNIITSEYVSTSHLAPYDYGGVG
jgi:hypothetical protein